MSSTTGNVKKTIVTATPTANISANLAAHIRQGFLNTNDKYYITSGNINEPSGNHFNQGTHTVADLTGCVLESVKSTDPFVLSVRESQLIQKFDTFRNGLNKEP